MYINFLYLITILFFGSAVIKASKHKGEWLLLLLILSYVKTCISYLFAVTNVFTVVTIGETQIHLDDIILVVALLYCLTNIIHPFKGGKYMASTLLLLIPVGISLFRGVIAGTIGSATFFADTRVYILFLVIFYAFYFLLRRPNSVDRLWKYEQYIDCLMNVVLIYTLIIWSLDLGLGINSLPGQINGTLSDGGSTFRVIGASQVSVIAIYTLHRMYCDLNKKKELTIRTLLFVVVLMLLQWRTVVAAFIGGMIILLFFSIKKNGISRKLMGEIAIVSLIAIGISLQGIQANKLLGMVSNLFKSFSSIWKGGGTFSTRTYVWTMILSSLTGMNAVLGRPFGQNLGVAWPHSAHNAYVDYISKMGYLGVICFILFMLFLIGKSMKSKEYSITAILFTLLIYWIGYGFTIEHSAVLGFIMAVLEMKEKGYMDRDLL